LNVRVCGPAGTLVRQSSFFVHVSGEMPSFELAWNEFDQLAVIPVVRTLARPLTFTISHLKDDVISDWSRLVRGLKCQVSIVGQCGESRNLTARESDWLS
jgi:hypothetical protein